MKHKCKVLLVLVGLALSGCVSGNWGGVAPGKAVHLKNFRQEITTPWGHSTTTADELDTTLPPNAPIVK